MLVKLTKIVNKYIALMVRLKTMYQILSVDRECEKNQLKKNIEALIVNRRKSHET